MYYFLRPYKEYKDKVKTANKDIISLSDDVNEKINNDYIKVLEYEQKLYKYAIKDTDQTSSCTITLIKTSLKDKVEEIDDQTYKEQK